MVKICELRFKNLNSLYGEWFIDFTDPEYLLNGIFALTGPTGAGKSTVLDAICLALYGATPRLGKITKTANEIMSRQTGECYAEVLFESQAGRYRCHWGQHRARKKVGGELQSPKHEISEGIDDGKVIEHQIRRVAAVIETKIGMDFERFTRSILLAQGGFDSFLKADIEQKSKILEQITGTEIYSDVSRKVHERQRDEREEMGLLTAEVKGITLLDEAQEQEYQQSLEAKQKEEAELDIKITQVNQAISWLTGIEGVKKQIEDLKREVAIFQPELIAFESDRLRLSWALKAAELDAEYATLSEVRRQQAADKTTLEQELQTLPGLSASSEQDDILLKRAEQTTKEAKLASHSAISILKAVRALDQNIESKNNELVKLKQDCQKMTAQLKDDGLLKGQIQEKIDNKVGLLTGLNRYLVSHAKDEWLVSGLAGVAGQLNTLVTMHSDIADLTYHKEQMSVDYARVEKKLAKNDVALKSEKINLDQVIQKHTAAKVDLDLLLEGRLLREYRTEHDTLLRELAFLAKIADLETERTRLEDDKACPLCGSEHHPFAEGNIPTSDATSKKIEQLADIIAKSESGQSKIEQAALAEQKVRNGLAEIEKISVNLQGDKKLVEKGLSDLAAQLDKKNHHFSELKTQALRSLQPLGIDEMPSSESLVALLSSLNKRLEQWLDQVKLKDESDKMLAEFNAESKRIDAIVQIQNESLEASQALLQTCQNEYQQGKVERADLFGNKRPDDEEFLLNKAVIDADAAEKSVRIKAEKSRHQAHSVTMSVEKLRAQIEARVDSLATLNAHFMGQLNRLEISSEVHFLDIKMPAAERDKLEKKAKSLETKKINLAAREKDYKGRLSAELDKKVTSSNLEALSSTYKALSTDLKSIQANVAKCQHAIAENSLAKDKIKDKQDAISAQKIECARWDQLHHFIGSADGKKYRNFAQGLTFELMVLHANRQLKKMTDRYLLVRDDKQPLELNVVDNYQAGEVRSTRNLSGGESFIVSLTLALGLSKMASRKVRVDSLFLDEGFGTLDEDALEMALEALSSLQQDDKLIGIISHVAALKERISTQISVLPISGGKSALSGPGCHATTRD